MKYKSGDNVRLRGDLVLGMKCGSYHYTQSMYKAHKPGDVVTIQSCYHGRYPAYSVKGHYRPWWTDEMFSGLVVDAVQDQPEEPQASWQWEDLF